MSLKYCARNPIIINYTLTDADTWYKVADAVKGVRKWMIKSSEDTPNPFKICFQANADDNTPAFSTIGPGFSLDNCDLSDLYARSSTAGTIVEILYFG